MNRRHYYGGGIKTLCGHEFSRPELLSARTRKIKYVNCVTCKRLLGVDGNA